MKVQNSNQEKNYTRREFIQQSAFLSAGILLAGSKSLLAESSEERNKLRNIASKGYAARDNSGILSPWSFERRSVGDNDILIEIKFCGVCHSDIHQLRGEWGPQQYPQVPGHEIAGVVAAVGKSVTKFKVGDHAGVGTMVDGCGACDSCKREGEQYCDDVLWTYGSRDKTSPTGITQGGYSNNIVVKESFAIKIPETIRLQDAASLLCAGITTYSPLLRHSIKKGDKVGVAGIGGLGHLAIKLAVAKGAEVYAFTTTESKVKDILAFGAKEAIVVDSIEELKPYNKSLDYMISTIPVMFDVGAYASLVKPYGSFTKVGMPVGFQLTINNLALAASRVNYNASIVGSIPLTQRLVDYCAEHKIYPQIQVIKASEVNEAWGKVVNKEARYRYVIDAATI
jgi:alcohol dehydrogenase (NADP+)/uncharacterized zinc-type alcohol dehydrogenase-like protein